MTNFKQNLTVLFWLYRQKAKADGKAPIYARITIDGKYNEILTGKKVNPASWDLDVKQVTGSGLEVKLAFHWRMSARCWGTEALGQQCATAV